jgi:hypothetical protein
LALQFFTAHNDDRTLKARLIVESISASFEHWRRRNLQRIQELTGIPRRTAEQRYRRWLRKPAWRSWSLDWRREFQQIFELREESEVCQTIRDELLTLGALFTDHDFH